MPVTYEPINTYAATSNVAVVTFSSIPSTYDELVLVINLVSVSGGTDLYMRFNNDSGSNYYRQAYYASNTTVYGQRHLGNTSHQMGYAIVGVNSGYTGQMISNIAGYASTNYLTHTLTRGNQSNSSTNNNYEVSLMSKVWNSTAVVNEIKIGGDSSFTSANIGAGSTLTLFGIKGA
jgi:hypothetical protein